MLSAQLTADICHDPDGTVLDHTGSSENSGMCPFGYISGTWR